MEEDKTIITECVIDNNCYKERQIKMSNERFKKIYNQGVMNAVEIWVDTVTGVNYLYHRDGYSGGLTPLLDENGKVVVSKNI